MEKILLDNGYPKNVINTQITKKIAQFSTLKRFGPEKCPVYLRYLGLVSPPQIWKKKSKPPWKAAMVSVSTRLIFTSKRMLPVARKDALPTTKKSSVIYEYQCHCDKSVRRANISTTTRSHQATCSARVKTTIDPSMPISTTQIVQTKPDCDSATGQHLLENDQCALTYDYKRFSILATARSSFHLNLLEAAYIKTHRLALCRQKEFVYALKLFRQSRHLASCCTFSNFRYCEIFLWRAL